MPRQVHAMPRQVHAMPRQVHVMRGEWRERGAWRVAAKWEFLAVRSWAFEFRRGTAPCAP